VATLAEKSWDGGALESAWVGGSASTDGYRHARRSSPSEFFGFLARRVLQQPNPERRSALVRDDANINFDWGTERRDRASAPTISHALDNLRLMDGAITLSMHLRRWRAPCGSIQIAIDHGAPILPHL
jgi:hypothetical protein